MRIPYRPLSLRLMVKFLCIWDCPFCPCCAACSSDGPIPMSGAFSLDDGYKSANLVKAEGQDYSCPTALTCAELQERSHLFQTGEVTWCLGGHSRCDFTDGLAACLPELHPARSSQLLQDLHLFSQCVPVFDACSE